MMATNVLEHALLGEDIAALDSAIEYAEAAGAKASLVDKARKRKQQMQEMVRVRNIRSQATSTLQLALAGRDLLALVQAYNVAFQAGVSEELLSKARKHKASLEEKNKEREKAKKQKEQKQRKEEIRGVQVDGRGRECQASEEDTQQPEAEEEADSSSEEEQSESNAKPKSSARGGSAPATESRRAHRTSGQPDPKDVPYTIDQATQILEFAMKEAPVQELQAAIRIGQKAGVSEALLRKAHERQEGLAAGSSGRGRGVDVTTREEAERQRAARREDDHVGREREPRHRSRRDAADSGRYAAEDAVEGRHAYQAAKDNGLSNSRDYREAYHERQRGSHREADEEMPQVRENIGRRAHLSRHAGGAEESHHAADRGLGRPPPPPLLTPRRHVEAERALAARNDSDAEEEEPSRHRASRREEDLRHREKEPRARPRREAAAIPPEPVARPPSGQRGHDDSASVSDTENQRATRAGDARHEQQALPWRRELEDRAGRSRKDPPEAERPVPRHTDRPPSRAEARQIAEKALEQATKGIDVDVLEASIAEAKERGVRDDLVKSSVRRLQELRVRAEQGKKASDAKKSLEYAVEHGQIQELRDAILHAVECGVDRSLVKQAVNRKQELEEEQQQKDQSRHAEQELLKIMAKGNAISLGKTLEWAIKVGISNELVDKAWKRKEELDDEEAGRHGSQGTSQRASDVPQEKSEKPTVTVRLTRRGSAAVSSKNAGATSSSKASSAAPEGAPRSFSKASSKPPAPLAQSKSGAPPPGAKTARAHNPPPLLSKPKRPPQDGDVTATDVAANSARHESAVVAEATNHGSASDPYDLPDDDDLPDEGYQAMLQEALRAAQEVPDGDGAKAD